MQVIILSEVSNL